MQQGTTPTSITLSVTSSAMQSDAPLAPPPPPALLAGPEPIAHWTHTVALLAVLLLTTFFGHARTAEPGAHLPRYAATIVLEWLLLGSVIAGIYHRRVFFLAAFRNRSRTVPQSIGLGFAVYGLGFMAVAIVGGALYFTPLFHQRNEAVVLALLPHTPLEFLLWFGVSLTAGICEELIFRGYLLQQITAWTGRSGLSIVLAALLFGSVHLYEGIGAILPLAALAVVYGLIVRHYRGDLRAVIVAHTLQDFLVAFIALARPVIERYQLHR